MALQISGRRIQFVVFPAKKWFFGSMRLAESSYHFIGIGGIGMCGLAELLHRMGAQVSGSDLSDNKQVRYLKNLGVRVYSEHTEKNIGEVDVVVYSSAIKPGHVELEAAKNRKIPLIPRAEALAELMRLKRGIAVAGTHGKTTTTSLLASSFLAAQQDPTIVVGGRLQVLGSTAAWGKGPWMIAEADESDGSFSKLSPEVVILTNIDNDHLDFYGSFEKLKESFLSFASQIPFYGLVMACGDDPEIRSTFKNFSKRIKYYGFDEGNDYRIVPVGNKSEIWFQDKRISEFSMPLPGKHNLLNAAATLAISHELGLPLELAALGVESFSGVERRAEWKGERNGVDVFDDYGHHPTEVKVTLEGFKKKFSDRRLVACFQPHRYTRTQTCWQEFLTSFELADVVWVTDIYPAGESPIEGVTAERLSKEVKHKNCSHVNRESLNKNWMQENLKSGDVFLTLGAGDSWKIGMEFLGNDD